MKINRIQRFLFGSLALMSLTSFAQSTITAGLRSCFGKYDGAFCLCDLRTGEYLRYNPAQCSTRFSPCSTFKIPNSLIGLETGVIPDTGFVIGYDSLRHPKDSLMLSEEPFKYWFRDLSLKQAFKYSCVWYYQELARRVGQERMQAMVKSLGYGNMDISSGLDSYWLCGSIRISADEQVEFLKKLYLETLPGFSKRSMEAVKQIMLYEETPDYLLYGKTGGGDCWENKAIGWYVGFVETASGPKVFAMNVIADDFGAFGNNFRIELTKRILRELKIIR